MSEDTTEPCAGCGALTSLLLLDVRHDKDGNVTDPGLYCRRCYGPGWLPVGEPPRHSLTVIVVAAILAIAAIALVGA